MDALDQAGSVDTMLLSVVINQMYIPAGRARTGNRSPRRKSGTRATPTPARERQKLRIDTQVTVIPAGSLKT